MIVRGYAHGARRFITQRAQRGELAVELAQHRQQRVVEPRAGFGKGDAARGARQQSDAKARLQRRNRMAQSRARHAELRGRSGEVFLTRHMKKGAQVVEIFRDHC